MSLSLPLSLSHDYFLSFLLPHGRFCCSHSTIVPPKIQSRRRRFTNLDYFILTRSKILKIVRASMELFCGGSLPLLRKYPKCFEGRRWKPRAYTPIEENEIQIKSESASGVYHNVLGFNKYM
ncbi:hypothetical protein ACSBR2_036352 [Camellia fascicularis]